MKIVPLENLPLYFGMQGISAQFHIHTYTQSIIKFYNKEVITTT